MSPKQPNYGIVYVLTNPAMPGMVKIGMTNRDSVDVRMKELFNTSVPVPFECEFACKVDRPDIVENALHLAFHPYRIHSQREFFKINPEQAVAILKLVDKSKDITAEIQGEINNDLTDVDKNAGEKLKQTRRPPLNFREMGIPVGSKLVYGKDDHNQVVEVSGDRTVSFNNTETSLTLVTRELLGLDYNVQPTPYWTYNGRNLWDIYNDTYVLEEE